MCGSSNSCLQSDNAQEFKSAEVLKILEEEKILPQNSNPREQFQNGKAEKCIGDCWAMTRPSLIFSNMTRRVWLHSAYVKGHLPTAANEGFKSPIHMMTGEKSITDTYTTFWLTFILC